jgi:uncharacterized membrane protein YhaH (DUF805 family)
MHVALQPFPLTNFSHFMNMEFISAFTLGYGRIARSTWLFRLAIVAIICTAFGMLAQAVAGDIGSALLALLFIWCACAVSVKRLHDAGRSAWSLLAVLVPVVGPIWLIMQLFRRGAEGRNRYGRDPLARLDYLRVDITK